MFRRFAFVICLLLFSFMPLNAQLPALISGNPPLPVILGGTGVATLATNGVVYGNAVGAALVTAQGPTNSVLTANAGAPSFSATPTLTSLTAPTLIGGSAVGQTLTFKTTTGVGTTDSYSFTGANNGVDTWATLNKSGLGIGMIPTAATSGLDIQANAAGGGGTIKSAVGTNSASFVITNTSGSTQLFTEGSVGGFAAGGLAYASGLVSGGLRALHLGTNSTVRMTIGSTGNVGIGVTAPTAVLHLKAGTATLNTAPFKFDSGTNLTTAEAGAMEYDGTNLFFTRAGTTRESVITSNAVNVVSPTAQNRTITVVIAGTTYYLTAKTTND